MKVVPFTLLVPDNKSVYTEHIQLPYFYPYLHQHREWQLTYVERGHGTLIAGSEMHPFTSGDVFLIGPGLPHLFKSDIEYFRSRKNLSISACSLFFNATDSSTGLFSIPEMAAASAFLKTVENGIIIPPKYRLGVAELMIKVHNSTGPELLFEFVKLMVTMQDMEVDDYALCSRAYSPMIKRNEDKRLSKILSYINENHAKQIALEDVADQAFMTPQAFCRYFKKTTGHTFVRFLSEVRIHQACKMLTATDAIGGIAAVAYKAGFNSINNFNRVFKSIVGQSPTVYRNIFRKMSGSKRVNLG